MRYPEAWVRAHGLLARMGDEASFRKLVDALLEDMATYSDEPETLVPMARVAKWTWGPSLGGMVQGAEPTTAHVLNRIERLYGSAEHWKTREMRRLRKALGTPAQEGARPDEQRTVPTDEDIEKRLASHSAEQRAEGLAAAGLHGRDRFYGKVLDTARRGTGIERQAALYGLGFYRRAHPEDALREMMGSGDSMERFTALELGTRTRAERFASEAMTQLRAMVAAGAAGPEADFKAQHSLNSMARVISRMVGSLPAELSAGLRDENAAVRRTVVLAIGLGGNPATAPLLEPMTHDPDPGVRAAAVNSLRLLGPAEP